jgi:hypothetical protein
MPRGGKRDGAGRKFGTGKGEGLSSHVVRVSSQVTKEQCAAIPELIGILDYWESECDASPDNPRYYYLKKALQEIRNLGL